MSDSNITKDTFPVAPKTHPVLAGLPQYLKNPENYDKVRKTIIETLAGSCSHGEIIEWAGCAKCQRRFAEKGALIKKLGFKSMAQYLTWQKIHEEIRNMQRMSLKKYDE